MQEEDFDREPAPYVPAANFQFFPESWFEQAKCKGESDTDNRWLTNNVPFRNSRRRRDMYLAELCNDCPVIRQCANWAVRVQITDMVCAGVATTKIGHNEQAYERLADIARGGPLVGEEV